MERNYVAFISYRHKPLDIAVAERIHRMIERYTIPRALRKNGEKRLGLVFRDRDELPLSNDLTEDIYTALDHSQYLIVVCTPDTPESLWVNQEIEHFIQRHGRHRVLTVLAAGTAEESIPKSITTTYADDGETVLEIVEPMCAYLSADSEKKVMQNLKTEFLRLVAAILECPYDALYQRRKRYVRRLLTAAVGGTVAVLLTVIALLIGWNRDVAALNEQISMQLRESQFRESQVVAMLSRQQMEKGDNSTVLRDILSVLPSEDNDRAYAPEAVKVLSELLGVYGDGGYGFGRSIQHNAEIISMHPSPNGRDVLVLDALGYITLYDLQTGEKKWETHLSIYNGATKLIRPDFGAVLFHLYDNEVSFSYLNCRFFLDYTTGEELNIKVEEGELSLYRNTLYTQADVDSIANYCGDERVIRFYDADGDLQAQTDFLPGPYNSEFAEAGYVGYLPPNLELYGQCFADGAYVCALYEQRNEAWGEYLYFVVVDDYTSCDEVTTYGPYYFEDIKPPLSVMFNRETGKIICAYEEQLLVVFTPTADRFGTAYAWADDAAMYELKDSVLTAWLQGNDLLMAMEDGKILRYSLDDYFAFPDGYEVAFDVGIPLSVGECSNGTLLAISKDEPYCMITVHKNTGSQNDQMLVADNNISEARYQILSIPQQNAIVVFSSHMGTTDGFSCRVSVCDAESFALIREFDVTVPVPKNDQNYRLGYVADDNGGQRPYYGWDAEYYYLYEYEAAYADAYGVTADGKSLIVNTYCLNLSTGELTAFDEKGYEQGEINGFTPQYAPYKQGQGLVTAAFETSTDVLTWWVDGENPKNTTCPQDIPNSDLYGEKFVVGGNGLILLRYYDENDLGMNMSGARTVRRPISYWVFSTETEQWKGFDNPCTVNGEAVVGLAQEKPLAAMVDYDGVLRIYDLDKDAAVCEYPMDITAKTVTQILFVQQDEVLLVCHQNNQITAVAAADGTVLGQFRLPDNETVTLTAEEMPEEERLYLYAADGSVTGIVVCTESWGVLMDVPRMMGALPESDCVLRWSEDGAELIVSPMYTVEELVQMGQGMPGQ